MRPVVRSQRWPVESRPTSFKYSGLVARSINPESINDTAVDLQRPGGVLLWRFPYSGAK
jgi:hypothetical protein